MTRTFLTPSQRRALTAAAGLVGRPHLRAGLAVTLAVACVPLDDPGTGESAGDTATSDDGSSSTIGGPTASGSASSDGGGATTGVATTSAGTSTGDDGTTIGTTVGTTLLTDASTSQATTGDDTTGDDTTGDDTTGGTTGGTGTTGDLGDCMDPRTGDIDWACCEAQNWEPVPQCTPWGPPAPPAVDAALLERARAARGRWV